MNIAAIFIRRPIATSLAMLALILLGSIAFYLLPIGVLPQVDFPTISVRANLAGASAETMATSVATPLERSLAAVPGVTEMSSSSSDGSVSITLQFDLSTNIDAATQDVQAALTAANGLLPKAMTSPPSFHKVNPADASVMSIALTSDTLPLTELDRYAEDRLALKISQLPGVGLVDFHGEARPAIRIQLNPDAMAQVGLTLEDVRSIIGVSTVNAPKGSLGGAHKASVIGATDQLSTQADFANLVLAYRDGKVIRVRDIGTALTAAEDAKQAAWLQNRRAVIIDIHKQPGFNVIETVRNINTALPSLTAGFPATVKVSVVGDRTQSIAASVNDVQNTLLLTIALVILVIYLSFRDARATIIPAVTIPLSLAGTFAVMWLLNYSLDNLSLMGLVISVGFLVDDAIVVVENVMRHLESGKNPIDAALDGLREIGFTVVSITFSLVAVFIPVLLMGGIIGRMFREFAVTVSVAIGVSAVVSLTVAPMLCSVLLKPKQDDTDKKPGLLERIVARCVKGYADSLAWILNHQPGTLVVTVALVLVTGVLFLSIPKGFFPQADTGLILAVAETSPDVSYEDMSKKVQAIGDIVMHDPAVDNVYYWIGTSPTLSQGRVLINLKDDKVRKEPASAVIARLRKNTAGINGASLFMQVRQDIQVGGRMSKTQYQYTLQNADVLELNKWSALMFEKMKALPQLSGVTADKQAEVPKTVVDIDRDTAARLGVSAQAVDETLYDAFGQRQVATLFTALDQYHVIEEVAPAYQIDESGLSHLYLRSTTTGTLVPLSAFSHISHVMAPQSISHQGLYPSVTLSFNLSPGYALGDAVKAVQALEATLHKPEGLTTSFAGTAKAFQDSLKTQPILVLAAIVAVYLILGILYESYIHPLTIISTLPSAGVGALLALQLFGLDLSVMGIIGILLLIGIVKKNAIMVIDFAISAERERGLAARDAIYEACLIRFRPIMMTTIAALLGALPLALGTGMGSELRKPMGIAVVGGLLLSQLVTLYTTPVVYLALSRLSKKRK